MPRRKSYSKSVIAADAVGLTHLILATLIVLVGEFTELFRTVDPDHGGVQFILRYLDAPVYSFISPFVPSAGKDARYMIMLGMMVVMAGSIVYGVLTYFVLKFGSSLFGSKD